MYRRSRLLCGASNALCTTSTLASRVNRLDHVMCRSSKRLYSSSNPQGSLFNKFIYSDSFRYYLAAAVAVSIPLLLYRLYRKRKFSKPNTSLQDQTSQPSDTPGNSKSIKSSLLETGADVLQKFGPVNQIHAHLCGFHFYAGEPHRQVEAHHYCAHLNDEVRQCVIYDSDQPGARLIGIEYVISERLFFELPEEEKKYWHSHKYEVLSGELVMPRIPNSVELSAMKSLVNTYGKTVHTWQIDRGDTLPLGPPSLMMGLIEDGQVDVEMLKRRNEKYGIDEELKRQERNKEVVEERWEVKPVAEGADAWAKGVVARFGDLTSANDVRVLQHGLISSEEVENSSRTVPVSNEYEVEDLELKKGTDDAEKRWSSIRGKAESGRERKRTYLEEGEVQKSAPVSASLPERVNQASGMQ